MGGGRGRRGGGQGRCERRSEVLEKTQKRLGGRIGVVGLGVRVNVNEEFKFL